MSARDDRASLTASVLYRTGRITFEDIWTANAAMRKCLEKARLAAPHDIDVLILGESGTGKNLLSRAIHNASPRRSQPFVEVNVAAVSETLLESELFGHVRGAFTDAKQDHCGYFEQAHEGTLFLDEIGNLSPSCQAKILTAVERRHILTVLRHTGWNITRAAELLDIARVTLYEKIKRYGLQPPSEAR